MLYQVDLGCKNCMRLDSRPFLRCMFTNSRLTTHYDTLGIPHTATYKQIKQAYIKLCKEHHPDANRNNQDTHDQIVAINHAYGVLRDELTRRAYDQEIGIAAYTHYRPVHSHTESHSRTHTQFHQGRRSSKGSPHNIRWTNPYANDETIHQKYKEAIEKDEEARHDAMRQSNYAERIQRLWKEEQERKERVRKTQETRQKEIYVGLAIIAILAFLCSFTAKYVQMHSYNRRYDAQLKLEEERMHQRQVKRSLEKEKK